MNGTASRQIRRDLRRTFGPDVLETIDGQGIVIDQLRTTLVDAIQETDRLRHDTDQVIRRYYDFTHRSFRERLRWLLTGR